MASTAWRSTSLACGAESGSRTTAASAAAAMAGSAANRRFLRRGGASGSASKFASRVNSAGLAGFAARTRSSSVSGMSDYFHDRGEVVLQQGLEAAAGTREPDGGRGRAAAGGAGGVGEREALPGDEADRLAVALAELRERIGEMVVGEGLGGVARCGGREAVADVDAVAARRLAAVVGEHLAGDRVQPRQRVLDLAGKLAPRDDERLRHQVLHLAAADAAREVRAQRGVVGGVDRPEFLGSVAHTRSLSRGGRSCHRPSSTASAPTLRRSPGARTSRRMSLAKLWAAVRYTAWAGVTRSVAATRGLPSSLGCRAASCAALVVWRGREAFDFLEGEPRPPLSGDDDVRTRSGGHRAGGEQLER